MSLFRQLLIAKSQEKKKPYYCEVEYLESTGAQYIDTGIKPIISNTVKPVIKLVHQFNTLETCRIFGATDNIKYFQFFNNATGDDGFGIQLFNTGGYYTKFTLDTDKHMYEINIVSSIAKQDDTKQSLMFSQGSIDYNLYLFARNIKDSANNYMKGKIFYFEYDDGVQHRQFIPVLDWNMKPCLYDKVSGQLFFNQGEGEFLYGRQIHPVEYLESTGTQYIDTGIITSESNRTVVKWEGFAGYKSGSSARRFIASYENASVSHYTEFNEGNFFGCWGCYVEEITEANKMYKVSMQINGSITTDFSIDVDGITYSKTSKTYQSSSFGKFVLFRLTASYAGSGQRIGKNKLWIDGELVRYFIPAIDENDTFFMFDNVTHTAYNNAGSGSFIGPTVAKDEQGKIVETEYE